jgi:hypothetical protein
VLTKEVLLSSVRDRVNESFPSGMPLPRIAHMASQGFHQCTLAAKQCCSISHLTGLPQAPLSGGDTAALGTCRCTPTSMHRLKRQHQAAVQGCCSPIGEAAGHNSRPT